MLPQAEAAKHLSQAPMGLQVPARARLSCCRSQLPFPAALLHGWATAGSQMGISVWNINSAPEHCQCSQVCKQVLRGRLIRCHFVVIVMTALNTSARGSRHRSFDGFTGARQHHVCRMLLLCAAGSSPAPCCEAGYKLMSWEALPGLARAGSSTEVLLSASRALLGEPFQSILPSQPPQPFVLPSSSQSSSHGSTNARSRGDSWQERSSPAPCWAAPGSLRGRENPQPTTRATLGTKPQRLPKKCCVPSGIDVEATAVREDNSHQLKCSSTRRWWCMGSDNFDEWIHAKEDPQFLMPCLFVLHLL